MQAEFCRSIAYEAARRGAPVNVHELWAALEAVDDAHPRLIVDIGSGRAVLWAWWSLGAQVVAVAEPGMPEQDAFQGDRLPEAVVELVGNPRDRGTALRVADQVAGRDVDVLVLGAPGDGEGARALFDAYASKVRERGLVLIHGITAQAAPGVRAFWKSLGPARCRELVGSVDPIGYGIFEIHGRDRVSHG